MKTRSILSTALGSFLFAAAVMMLLPTLASATFQGSSPPRVSQATQPRVSQTAVTIGKHLSAQQMKATKGASGMICSSDCYTGGGTGINGCGQSNTYPPQGMNQCFCSSTYYHHPICVPDSNWYGVYSTCTVSGSMDCYDYTYYYGGCPGTGTYFTGPVRHMVNCCGQ